MILSSLFRASLPSFLNVFLHQYLNAKFRLGDSGFLIIEMHNLFRPFVFKRFPSFLNPLFKIVQLPMHRRGEVSNLGVHRFRNSLYQAFELCETGVVDQRGGLLMHKGFSSEPTHMEDENEEQKNEKEDERDSEEYEERVEERSNTQAHDTWMR